MNLRLFSGAVLFVLISACSLPAITDSRNTIGTVNSEDLTILDHYVIPSTTEVNGLKVTELSGLAWDEDEQLLYAVSDRGRVYHFRLVIENDLIKSVTPVFAAKLLDSKGKKLKKNRRDSEGLMVWNADNGKKGDTQLIISLEGEPRIVRFTPQGRAIENIAVPKPLRDRHKLRAANNGLESVTYHPKYGFMTAPEEPLKGKPKNLHTVYAAKKQWSFMAYPAPNSSITALEIMPGSNNLLVMERAWSGFPNPMVISLRRVNLDACSDEGACQAENLKVFSSSLSIDNFEGMTALGNNRYLIVSDDGQNDLLRTLLTLFKVD
ncbi:MAG: esterase-like activity of phytase family protein [Thiolinea sp.]